MTNDLGFIGLGRMGGPMARNLAVAGYPVHVFDVDVAAVTRLAAVSGVTAHRAPQEVAAHAAVLFTALPNDQIVKDTYLGDRGILSGAQAGAHHVRLFHREPRGIPGDPRDRGTSRHRSHGHADAGLVAPGRIRRDLLHGRR